MAFSLKQLSDRVINMVKTVVQLRSIDRAQLVKVLQENLEMHEMICKALATFQTPEVNRLKQKYFATEVPQSKVNINQIPNTLLRLYTGKAQGLEMKRFFGALEQANKQYIGILKEIIKHIDVLFDKEEITIYNSRMSAIMVFGIIQQSDMVGRFTTFLWTHVMDTITHGPNTPPQYRALYLVKHVEAVASVVNNICARESSYSFLHEVDRIRKQNADMVLYANGVSFLNFLDPHAFNQAMTVTMGFGLGWLNIFAWTAEVYDSWQHSKYLRNKELKEWMEQHVALIRMELNGKDPNSPEYQRLLKIIQAYDERITDLDSKIDKYLKADED